MRLLVITILLSLLSLTAGGECLDCDALLCPATSAVLEGTLAVQVPPTLEVTAIHGVPTSPIAVGDRRLTIGPSVPVLMGDKLLAYIDPGSGTVYSFARVDLDGSVRCGGAVIPVAALIDAVIGRTCPAALTSHGWQPSACPEGGCAVAWHPTCTAAGEAARCGYSAAALTRRMSLRTAAFTASGASNGER